MTRPLRMTKLDEDGFPSFCFVYWNFNKKCWSLRSADPKVHNRIVVAHALAFQMDFAHFEISEISRQRVIREKRKNVHAGVVGSITWFLDTWGRNYGERVEEPPHYSITYNPYTSAYFQAREIGEEGSLPGPLAPVEIATKVTGKVNSNGSGVLTATFAGDYDDLEEVGKD